MYYPQQDLLKAKQKGGDFWLQKSWLGAKGTLLQGLRWNVADGKSIQIWEDRWILDSMGAKLMSKQPANFELMMNNKDVGESKLNKLKLNKLLTFKKRDKSFKSPLVIMVQMISWC